MSYKFKNILLLSLLAGLGVSSLVSCGENDVPPQNENGGENNNQDNENGDNENTDPDGDDSNHDNDKVEDDAAPETLTRYDLVFDNLNKDSQEVNSESLNNLYSTNLDYIDSIEASNVYSYTNSNYALSVGTKKAGGSLTFTFKEDIYIKDITLKVSKWDQNKVGVNLLAKKNLTQEIDGEYLTFKGVNKFTNTLTIQRGDIDKGVNRFFLYGFEINGGETTNIPEVKTSRIEIDSNITGGKVKFASYSIGQASLNSEIEVVATPDTNKVLKTLVVNDGTEVLDILTTKKFKIIKENVTYKVSATFGIEEDSSTPEAKTFKISFDTFTSNSTKFGKEIANDSSNMLKELTHNEITPEKETKSLQIGSKNSLGTITFKLNSKVIINKFTLSFTKGVYGAKAIVILGTKELEFKVNDENEITLALDESVTTNTIIIKNKASGMRFNLKSFEVNSLKDVTPDTGDETTKKIEVKCLNPDLSKGKIWLEGANLNESKFVPVNNFIIVHYEAKEGYKLKKLTYKVNEDGTPSEIRSDYSGYNFKVLDIDGIYIVEAVFEEKGNDSGGGSEVPVDPVATKSLITFDKVKADGGKALSPNELKDVSTFDNKVIKSFYPRQVFKGKNDILKFTGLRFGSDTNLGQLEINLTNKTIINNITLDLTAYDFIKTNTNTHESKEIKDISRISVILDETLSTGEYDVTTKKLVIPFDGVVASKIIIRTNGPKERCYLRSVEINSEFKELTETNAPTINLSTSANGTVKIDGLDENNKINLGKVATLKARPNDGYYLDSYEVKEGNSTLIYGKISYFKPTKANATYLITPKFKEIKSLETQDLSTKSDIISFDKNINNFDEHLTNVRATYTDNSNLISSIDLGQGKIYGGEGLKVNFKKEDSLKFTFTREIEISNLVINAPSFNYDEMHETTYEVLANNTLANERDVVTKNEPLKFTFNTPVLTNNLTINIKGDDARVVLKYIIFNEGLETYLSETNVYSNYGESTSVDLVLPAVIPQHINIYLDESYTSDTLSGTRINVFIKPDEGYSLSNYGYLTINGKLCYDVGEKPLTGISLSFILETGLNVVEVILY